MIRDDVVHASARREIARARGLLFRCGNDFAAFAPPLICTAAEIDEMVGILSESLTVAQRELGVR